MVVELRLLAFSDWRVQRISDAFNFIRDLDEPVDFILYAGDDVDRFEEEGVNYFTELSEHTRQKKLLAVIGNDDFPMFKGVLEGKNVQDLHEKPFIFKDFAFIGLEASTSGPGIVKHSEKEVKKHLKKQYGQVKGKKLIILSHTPPYGVLDRGIRFAKPEEGYNHIGSTSLRNFIQQNKANLVICGHCHSHGGLSSQFMDTTVVNVSSHDSPGSKGNFALIEINFKGEIKIEWHDTAEKINRTSLRYLHGIGIAREAMLHKVSIRTVNDLIEIQDLEPIVKQTGFSFNFLKKLQLRAQSVLDDKIFQVSPLDIPENDLIFFDIETDIACKRVWLIGILKDGEFTYFYADDWKQEKTILANFMEFLKANPNYTLVSFSGTDFDKNVVQGALTRLKFDSHVFSFHPHIDLCQALRRSYIFPNQSYALKELGSFLGYPFKHPDLEGLRVALEYHSHLSNERKIDPRVFEYNEDDVKALPFIIEKVAEGIVVNKEFLEETLAHA